MLIRNSEATFTNENANNNLGSLFKFTSTVVQKYHVDDGEWGDSVISFSGKQNKIESPTEKAKFIWFKQVDLVTDTDGCKRDLFIDLEPNYV